MGKKRLTTKQYKEKFDNQLNRVNYIPQDGEKIVQCHAPYPSYWFISNMGYLFTAWFNEFYVVKPNYRETGIRTLDGKRNGKEWYYEYKEKNKKHNTKVPMHKLMAEHFHGEDYEKWKAAYPDEPMETHHINGKQNFSENDGNRCNRASNLQPLPQKIHKELTKIANPNYEKNKEKKIVKALEKGTAQMMITDQLTPDVLKSLMKGITWDSGAVISFRSLNTNETLAFLVPDHVAGDPLPDILNWTCSRESSLENHKN